MITMHTLYGGMLAIFNKRSASLAVLCAACVLGATASVGLILWARLYFRIQSLSVAGHCVTRVLLGLSACVAWTVAGTLARSRSSNYAFIVVYLFVSAVLLFLAVYSVTFLWWAAQSVA